MIKFSQITAWLLLRVSRMDTHKSKYAGWIFRTPHAGLGTIHCRSIKGRTVTMLVWCTSPYQPVKFEILGYTWAVTHVTPEHQFYCWVASLTSEHLCLIYTNMKPEWNLMHKTWVPIKVLSAEILSSDWSMKHMKAVFCALSMLMQAEILAQSAGVFKFG